ncbi:MAG: PEP-CTERM sorting domain-containing protein, partial [Betaproteobacteria bacterium]|nr:PEP-CTERM sorting domain-containing protein [Betaproteobacteria bacterium]
ALNENGTLINFEWVPLLKSVGNGNTDTAALGYCSDCLMNTNVYEYTPATGTVELVFFWGNEHQTFYSAVYDEGKWRNPVDASGNKWDMITYTATGATVGFEDGGGTPKCLNCKSDWDWNDVVITLTNVGAAPPSVIPEPETYAMLLAGLGVVGAVVRRRRIA